VIAAFRVGVSRALRSPTTALGLWVAAILLLHVVWLLRFRSGAVPEYDESGYMAIALHDLHGLQDHGLRGLASAYLSGAPSAPIVPLFTVLPYLLVGGGVGISIATQLTALAVLAAASFALARRVMEAHWAALAAGITIALPVVSDYSRIFHFAVPAAAFLTAAAWALACSDGLRRLRWATLAGFLLGCMVLSRTMTIAYLPGIGIAALVMATLSGDDRRRRLRSLAALVGAAAAVVATWMAPRANYRAVIHYLAGTGYGERASEYGTAHSPLSPAYWSKQLGVVANEVHLPLILALSACVVAYAVTSIARRRPRADLIRSVRRLYRSELLIPIAIVVEGYAALSSSHNVGTAFSLPWLPSLVVLCVYCVSRVVVRGARITLVALLIATTLFAVAGKSDSFGVLAERRVLHIPGFDTVAVTDGDWLARKDVEGAGYHLASPDHRLPALHRRWLPFTKTEMQAVLDRATPHGRPLHLVVATGDGIMSTTRFALAAQLAERAHVRVERLAPAADAREYTRLLQASMADVVVTADPPPSGGDLDQGSVVRAARDAGYVPIRTSTAPDGRTVTWWSHA
jgi:4-amino-4-deoxy-L-arabinose transferase-like glycosyltransferase